MILPLVAPAVLLASPVDLPMPDPAAAAQGIAAQPAIPVPLPPVVPFIDPAQVAAGAPAAPAGEANPVDIDTAQVAIDYDPLEGFNRTMFGIHQALDKAIWRPVAMGYKTVVPKPIRAGARNALSNLTEPYVFVNFLLQGKPGKAAETFARFLVNSTLGIGGLFDVAKTRDFNLPHRPNGFGTTLALHGVKPGPYLFLPFLGPTTFRDVMGDTADDSLLPIAVGKPFATWKYQIVTGVVNGLDMRAEADPELRALFADAIDPYATLRAVYLQNRAAEIEEVRGGHAARKQDAAPELDAPLEDPAATVSGDATGDAAGDAPSDVPELRDPLKDPS